MNRAHLAVSLSLSYPRASVRLEDSYLHVPGCDPSSDPSPVFRQRPDDPTVLPSLRRHQWGRLLALGNLTLKIEKSLAVEAIPTKKQTANKKRDDSGIIEGSDAKETKKSSPLLLRPGWTWEDFIDVLVTGKQASVTGEGSSLMVEWSTPTAVALLRTLQHLKQHYKLFGVGAGSEAQESTAGDHQPASVSLDKTEDERSKVDSSTDLLQSETPTAASQTYSGKVLQGLSKVALSFHFTDANAFVHGVTPGDVTTCLY